MKRFGELTLSLLACGGLLAQNPQASEAAPVSENGAVFLNFNGGWTFGLPANRAVVSIPGAGQAISPEKKVLPAYGLGFGVRAWKYLVPFGEFAYIDTGKAFAQVGSVRQDVKADTYQFHGGVRLIRASSRVRPYAQFGGGVLSQKGTFTTTIGSSVLTTTAKGSIGLITYGAGVQYFVGRRWGGTFGFDGHRGSKQFITGGQNYTRFHFGWFFQTKSSVD